MGQKKHTATIKEKEMAHHAKNWFQKACPANKVGVWAAVQPAVVLNRGSNHIYNQTLPYILTVGPTWSHHLNINSAADAKASFASAAHMTKCRDPLPPSTTVLPLCLTELSLTELSASPNSPPSPTFSRQKMGWLSM